MFTGWLLPNKLKEMGALELRHKDNILYREDTLSKRIELLYKWTLEGMTLEDFSKLIANCTPEQVESDIKLRNSVTY